MRPGRSTAMCLPGTLPPSFNDAAFIFTPPPDAKKIVLAQESADTTEQEQ